VRVVDERRRRQGVAGGVARDDVALRRADAVGVPRDTAQARRGRELAVGARIVGGTLALAAEQLDERRVDAAAAVQQLEVVHLEGLDDDLRPRLVELVLRDRIDERSLQRKADRAEVARVLGLGIEPDHPAELARQALGEVDDAVEGRDPVAAVVDRVALAQLGNPLLGAQRAQLSQREVLGEPALQRHTVDDLRRAASCELGVIGDVGGPRDLVLVAGDEDVVLGRDQIGLDVVRAHPRGEGVGGERVLGAMPGRPAMTDRERLRGRERDGLGGSGLGGSGLGGSGLGGVRAGGHSREHDDRAADRGEGARGSVHATPHWPRHGAA